MSNNKPEAFSARDKAKLYKSYAALYKKALPGSGVLKKEELELADFALSGGKAKAFKKTGLGLKVVCSHAAEYSNTLIGHTGKILMNLPYQFMPEHKHIDVDVFPKGTKLPEGYTKMTDLINDFEGIYDYNSDGTVKMKNRKPVFRFRKNGYIIAAKTSLKAGKPSKEAKMHFDGKSETFKMVYGEMLLFSDKAQVLTKAQGSNVIPAYFKKQIDKLKKRGEVITTKKMIYMGPGSEVLLPTGTLHAIIAGKKGAVFLEFSTPTLDEADVFTDKRIIR